MLPSEHYAPCNQLATVENDVVSDTRHQLAGPAFGEGLARAQR